MAEDDLTPEQRDFVDTPGSVFAEACPGAGKTRAIVARYLKRTAEEKRKGVALLSFTNAAVDEVEKRCGGSPDQLRHPHFAGTFDSFINRFIIGPRYARKFKQAPKFIDSWDSQDSSNVRVYVPKKDGGKMPLDFKLEWFDFQSPDACSLATERVSGIMGNAFLKHYDGNKASINKLAAERLKARLERGYVSCSASRMFLRLCLANSGIKTEVQRLLIARFAEIIVDEAQDCGAEELALLELLFEGGTRIAMVGDPDQAIFEFRRALPEQVQAFGKKLIDKPLRLSKNFRSAPAICDINRALRASGAEDKAEGKYAGSKEQVQLLAFSALSEVAPKVRDMLDRRGIPLRSSMVISHITAHATAAAGGRETQSGGGKTLQFAQAALVLSSKTSTPLQRRRTMQRAEEHFANLFESTDDLSTEELADKLGVSVEQLRSQIIRLLTGHSPAVYNRTSYAEHLRQTVENMTWPKQLPLKTLGPQLSAPPEDKWNALGIGDLDGPLPSGTIHSAKGREFHAVCVVVPKDPAKDANGLNCLDHWDQKTASETRRVLYVGVSRAEALLMLAVHDTHKDRLVKLLERDSVPYEVAGE